MGLRLVVPPAVEPITLQEAKAQCRVTHSAEDELIGAYLSAARERCEEFQRRSYVTQTWELTLDGFSPEHCGTDDGTILLPRPPIQSIVSVKYFDSDGVDTTLDPSAYLLDAAAEPGRLRAAFNTSWPAHRPIHGAVRIRYVAGYAPGEAEGEEEPDLTANVPNRVKQAIRFEVAHFYANRENEITGTIATELHGGAKSLLRPDRVPPVTRV